MSFKISKMVPLPNESGSGEGVARYPFEEMEIGDSFFVSHSLGESVKAAYCSYGKRHNKKFVSRRVGNGRRVWRKV